MGKGRKKGGGIRFGEMERDSLLAHGTSYLLHDRLMRQSDYDVAYVCPSCGSSLTPQANARSKMEANVRTNVLKDDELQQPWQMGEHWECPPCTRRAKRPVVCHPVPMPWVFRYLAAEMAAMNVKVKIGLGDQARMASLSCVGGGGGVTPVKPEANDEGEAGNPGR